MHKIIIPTGKIPCTGVSYTLAFGFQFNHFLYRKIRHIEGNFHGAKYSEFSWLKVWPQIFYPRMKWPCLPLPVVQTLTTKILPTKCLKIAEPRIFCSPKIPRYTVLYIQVGWKYESCRKCIWTLTRTHICIAHVHAHTVGENLEPRTMNHF